MSTRKRPSSWSPVLTLMFRQVSLCCLLQGCHSASFGSTRNTVVSLNDWWLKQTRSAPGIKCGSTRQRQTNDSRYCQRHQAWCGGPFLVSGWHAVLYSGGDCDSTIAARCCMAWRKFRKLLPVLAYRQPHLRCMARCTQPLFTWLNSTISKRGAWTPWTLSSFATMTPPWSDGSAAPKSKMKRPQSHYTRNLALR